MKKVWFAVFLFVVFFAIILYWFYGGYVFISTPILLLTFLMAFKLTAFWDSIQAEAIPGIEKLDEPDFFFSRMFMAWLYANDKQRWAKYAATFSYIVGFLFSVLIVILVSHVLKLDFDVLLIGWIFGMFMTLLLAVKIATGKRWTMETKYCETRFENDAGTAPLKYAFSVSDTNKKLFRLSIL